MLSRVKKRNGNLVSYDKSKIVDAVFRAIRHTLENGPEEIQQDFQTAFKIASDVDIELRRYSDDDVPGIEQIQDVVEKAIMANNLPEVAKAYILYREKHKKFRDARSIVLDITKTMEGYLQQKDWRVNENANVNYSLGGLILHNSGTIIANYWLNDVYDKEVADAHRNGDFHIHDLSMLCGYCAGWSLGDLLRFGLGGVPGKITSKPASHLSTAVNQMVNFLGILQNEWAGAMAFSSFDTLLAPFVRNDKLSFNEVKQNIQSFIFGVNTPSRWGSQSPFTNITLDWTVPTDLTESPAIVGGKAQNFTYGECQREMDMINKAFLELMLKGDGEKRGFSYPIPTYNITKDFDWESENAQLLFKMAGKYGTPYFQNFINSDLNPSDVRSMCCRLQMDMRVVNERAQKLEMKGGGLFGAVELTGSIGVVTINLPRIGYLADTEENYLARVGDLMDLARDSLEQKRKVVTTLMDGGLFPYSKRYLHRGFSNHFSTIGLIGMNESTMNFMGKDMTDPEAREFSKRVLIFMRERLKGYQSQTGNMYNLEATPGEGTSYRLAKRDKDKYPDMVISGNKQPYYTNSTQLPVNCTEDMFDALDMQDGLQSLYTGGTVFHAFVGEAIDDPEMCGDLVRRIAEGYRLPYFTITPTFSICKEHGYLKGEQAVCPHCGEPAEVYSRIVGYYRPLKNWNKGKKEEYNQRREYSTELSMSHTHDEEGAVGEVA